MRSAARKVEEESSGRIEKEGRGSLQQRSARESTPTGARMVHQGGDSNVYAVRKM